MSGITLEDARYILEGSSGILCNDRSGRRLYKVIVNGHQVGLWSKRRWARRDLRQQLKVSPPPS